MEKTATLNLRVNPNVKKSAEEVLSQLGVPMSTAVDMYLRQIALTGGIPFDIALPKAPQELDMDKMTTEEIYAEIRKGIDDMEAGRVMEASEVFKKFKESL